MLFDYYSPIYTNIATYTNHTSNNIYAESIFKYLGYQKYKVGTFETGGFVIDDFIKKNNLVAKGVSIVDGSGLSRQNMMTTKFMCSFLAEIAKKHMGSTDYRNASPKMREILVKHVNTDISDKLNKIKCPTLLIWGSLDEAVPLKRAYELEKKIKDSAVIVYKEATHYAYLERLEEIAIVLNSFFDS